MDSDTDTRSTINLTNDKDRLMESPSRHYKENESDLRHAIERKGPERTRRVTFGTAESQGTLPQHRHCKIGEILAH